MNDILNSTFSLDGKVIVITGASGLLGRKHADAIAAHGGLPVLIDIRPKSLNQLKDEIKEKYNISPEVYELDITNEAQVENNAKALYRKFGYIDGLLNNAANNPKVENSSSNSFTRLENFSLDSWNEDLAVGLTGAFLCAKHYGFIISKNPKGGSIINVSSDLGIIAPDQRLYYDPSLNQSDQPVKPISYSVIKTGLIGLTRYLSTYWANKNVRCNALCPGGVENGQSEIFIKSVSNKIPMGRLARPDEYQGTIIWMLSDASSYLNGAIIAIDGGRTSW